MKGRKGMSKKKMTEQVYITLKLMVKGGATMEQLNAIHPLSKETLRRIKRTNNFDEYRALQEKYSRQSAENKAKKAAEPEQIAIEDVTPEPEKPQIIYSAGVLEAVEENTRVLKDLLEKVSFLVDAFTK
jgi:hypothetical protein